MTHPTVIVGAGSLGREVVRALSTHPQTGLRAVGFIDAAPSETEDLPVPLIGHPKDLADILQRTQARALIVADGALSDSELVSLVRNCRHQKCEVFVLPRLHQVTHVGQDMDTVEDLPLVRLRRSAYRSTTWRIKRVVDVIISGVALVVLAIPMALIALAVRLEGGPGVIFRQERVGCDGVPFRLLKFRSMRPADDAESQTTWNISTDRRIGPVGRFLRKTSLDELPQLINILRGDMSLVGPRPERPASSTSVTPTGTECRADSPAGRRCTACVGTHRSTSGPGSTTSTSRTGHSGSTSRSSCGPRCPWSPNRVRSRREHRHHAKSL